MSELFTDQDNLAWIRGFRARIESRPRPTAVGQKRLGWDAAEQLLAGKPSGGYGAPVIPGE